MKKPWLNLYDRGVPHSIFYPPLTVKYLFNHHAATHPERDYLIIEDIRLSYGLCNVMARKFANALLGLGVGKGDRVALMAPNVPQYVLALHACFKIGAVVVPVNPLATEREIAHALSDSGAEMIIAVALFAHKPIAILKAKETPLKKVLVVQLQSMPVEIEPGDGVYDTTELIGPMDDAEPTVPVFPDDVALLQYTGGTTGVSKGCVLLHKNLVSMAYQETYWFAPILDPAVIQKTLAAIPLYHIFGFNTNVNFNLVVGGAIVLVPQPTTDNLLAAINKHEPTFFAAVPTMIIGLNQHAGITGSKVRSIKGMISGSAPLPLEALRAFESLSGAVITEGYGLSETSNVLTCNPIHTVRKPGGVGLPFPDNELRIVDLDTGTRDMPIGEVGEIVARGPTLMREYWNKPEETAQAVRDGWLYTGDIGRFDEEGHLFIVDRKKDMILCSGFNVYPREIDELLHTHPKVLRACSFGIPDQKRGETVKVCIVTKPGETLSAEEVIEFCRQALSPYKVPKVVEFVPELPLTAVGKPDRKALRQREATLHQK